MYRISEESRRAGLACLYSAPDGPNHPVLLQNAQLKALRALNCWPGVDQPIEWYAGSALINALALIDGLGSSALELYECLPETRRILRSVLVEARPPIPVSVLPTVEQSQTFDGEVHIKGAIAGWSKQDLILLDPFAMWRQAEHQAQRDRYGAIIDGLIAHASEAPSLILFWTWGRNYPSAESDLDGTAEPVKNGYAELRAKLHRAGFQIAVVRWRWGFQFAMWVVVPVVHLVALRDDIDSHCRILTDHLIQNGYSGPLRYPQVELH
jgi:hypothetical protein